jgi:hypothetical protein
MAATKKIASGSSEWCISVWTATACKRNTDAGAFNNGGMHVSREHMKSEELERRDAKGDDWLHPKRGVSWTTEGSGHRGTQCMHAGAAARSQCAWESGQTHELLTFETEGNLGALWDQDECNQLCSKEEFWEAEREEEMRIMWTEE